MKSVNSWIEERETLCKLYIDEGKSLSEIAAVYHVDKSTVHYWLKKLGIPRRKGGEGKIANVDGLQFKNKDWLTFHYVDKRLSIPVIATMTGLTIATIFNWLKRFGIPLRPIHEAAVKKEFHPNWQGGITPLFQKIRGCSKMTHWRRAVLGRGKNVCAECFATNTKVQVDHIKSLAIIVQTNNIETLEQALLCEELWDVNNGRILCVTCHKKTSSWGRTRVEQMKTLSKNADKTRPQT